MNAQLVELLCYIYSLIKLKQQFNKYISVALMKLKDSDQSDNQGFVPNQIKIDSQSIHREEINHTKSKKFEAHYIVGQGLLRKQPAEAIKSFSNIPRKPRTCPIKKAANQNRDGLPTVHQLFNNKNMYSLVYSRFKQPLGFGQRCAFEHEVKLNCCDNEHEQNFKIIKDWDQKCLEQSSFTGSTLVFDSLFQGGNLRCAFKQKKSINTYVLFMQNDTNTYGYNQWFYFSIRNARQKTKYTFKIANFKKSYSFYDNGLQPLVFSLQKDRKQGQGWYRDGISISYSPSNFYQQGSSAFYTLQFSLQFDYPNDFITLSPNPPYSYTKLITTMSKLEQIASSNKICWKAKSIGNSIAENQVPYVVISNKSAEKKQKKKILLFARQHSGEIWSSFLAQEIMLNLVQQHSTQAKWLLQHFDFHIFPMINVDGVIYGNFRCDIAGNDLNRTWKSPLQYLQPQIYKIKREVMKLSENQSIQMCLDLHTHSKDYGIFGYCCVDTKQCREFPLLLSKSTPLFRYGACTFGISGQKQYTARASVFGMTNNVKTVTIELSAYGYKVIGRKYAIPYTPNHMRMIASSILKTYYAYKNNIEPPKEIWHESQEINELQLSQSQEGSVSNVDMPIEGSDSEPQADEIEVGVKIKKIYPPRFIEDIQYSKYKKRSRHNSKKFKNLRKQVSTIKYENKPQKKLKAHSTQGKQQAKIVKTPPIIFDQPVGLIKDQFFQNQVQAKNSTFYYSKQQPLYKKQIKAISEKTKKPQNQRPAKPLNLVEFSLKKLPIFPPQKPPQPQVNPHILLNQLSYISGVNPTKKKQERFDKTYSTYEAMVRPRVRIQSRKLGFERENSRLQQELPFLCIMSQNKKQIHIEKSKQKSEERQAQKKAEVNYLINGRAEQKLFMKYRDKQKNYELYSKTGLQNFTRYAENTFFRKP